MEQQRLPRICHQSDGSCGYKSKDIREILIELYEVFDFCSVEEAANYYEHWQP